ncbi:MAG: iron ABC transporter permease [Pseudomonadota bacterium]
MNGANADSGAIPGAEPGRWWPVRPGLIAGLVVLLCLLLLLAIGVGSSWLSPERVLLALVGEGGRMDQVIVQTLRLPRALLAAQAGVCLALAGALLQRATRNPLASPSVVGIVDGAAVGVVLFLWLFSNEANALTVSIHFQPLAAAAGAVVFAAIVGLLIWLDDGGPMRLIIYGVAIAALASAIVTLLIILGPVFRASQALIWLAGSVHQAHWDDVVTLAILLAMSLPILALVPRVMDQFLLDDDTAAATGLAVGATRALLLLIAVYLTASAVSFVGGIAFVGLIAPHVARLILGQNAGPYLIGSALIGAIIVLASDIVARLILAPLELPTGAVTALIGAPYFLFILIRRGRSHA